MSTEAVDADSYPRPRARGGCPFDPFEPAPEYAHWRAEGTPRRVRLPNGRTAWLVTRYADARQVLRDARFSSNSSDPGYPAVGAAVEVPPLNTTFIGLDGAEHARVRRMFAPEFTPARVAALRPGIQRIVDERVDRMTAAGPPADLVDTFALPVASQVICLLLGVPYAWHELFERETHVLTDGSATPARKAQAGGQLLGMLEELAALREKEPRDDLTSRVVARHVRTGELTRWQAVLNLALLLGAGHDTSANMTALAVLALTAQGPWPAPGGIDEPLVDELLRHLTIVQLGICRVAVADVVVGGRQVRCGEGVIVSVQAANRDGAVFPDPGRLDPGRPGARRQLAFGHGVHQCLGQTLARAELRIALDTLAARLPGLRPAVPVEELSFKDGMDFYGLHAFPVTW
ncbi:cytochrome P450 [Actinobacteria bacterium OK074]|nr:cytochrome P450 [Actinobacteria bacterium OK074]